MTGSAERLPALLREAVAHLRDYGNEFEDDGSNEPLDLASEIEELLQAPPAAADADEDAYVIERLGRLLAEIAIIVNGTEPHDTLWSYHDLPEKVRALKQAPPAAAVSADIEKKNPKGDRCLSYGINGNGQAECYWPECGCYPAPPAAAVPEDAIEAAYWDFDARHKGYGRHKTTPQSERDAFKWAVRSLLAAAQGVK